MEEGVYLVCEALGVSVNDAVTAGDVGVLYEKVVHRPTSPCLTQNAISQVTGKTGGKSCSAGKVLQVLMEMEKERKRKEELYWDDQLLGAGEAAISGPIASCCQHRQSKGKWCLCIWKLRVKAKQLSIRLALEGPWNVLPSLRYGNQVPRKQEWPQPSSITQIPLLMQRKYDIIRERLYAEMLHEGHGGVWWEGLSPEQREESVCELEALVERALSDRDMVALSHLPGAFRIYSHQVPREVSEEKRKLREQLHLAHPQEQLRLAHPQEQLRLAHPQELAWTALLFLMELESSYQEESRALHTLMTRLDQTELRDVCTSLRSAVTRAQKETKSYSALLTARQNWENWPNVTTDVKAEHLTPLIRKRDQHQDTNNMLCDLYESTQERPAQPPSSTNAETDNGDQLLIEETPYLEILCQRSQCDRQPEEPIESEEEEGLEKQSSVIAAAWSDIVEPANGESASQSPLDQDQDLDSEEETSGEENLDLTPTHQHTPEDKPATHTTPHTHSHTTDDPQTEHTTHHSSEEQNTPADTQASPQHTTQPSQHPEEDPRQQKPSSDTTQCHAPENTANADAQQQQTCLEHQPDAHTGGEETLVCVEPPDEKADEGGVCRVCIEQDSAQSGDEEGAECVCDEDAEGEVDVEKKSRAQENVCVQDAQCVRVDGVDMPHEGGVCEDEVCVGEASASGDGCVCEEQEDVCAGGVCEEEESTVAGGGREPAVQEECVCGESVCVCVPALQREETMRSLVDMQRKLELRYQRERERHTLRIQERLTIIQNRKSEDDLLGIGDLSTFTKEEDEQIQKMLVRERLEQLRRERSYILQTRRERNTAGFKELLGPTAQHTLLTED